MVRIKDLLGTECEQTDMVIIKNALGDDTLIFKENREKGLADFKILEPALFLLDDVGRLESMLATLDDQELDKLYSHQVVKDFDLLP